MIIFKPCIRIRSSDIIIGRIKINKDLDWEEFDSEVRRVVRRLIDVETMEREEGYDYYYDYYLFSVKIEEQASAVFDVVVLDANRVIEENEPYVKQGEEFEVALIPVSEK